MARTTEAANSETENTDKGLDTVTGRDAQSPAACTPAEPLARIGQYALLDWERCIPPATGRVGIAIVLLPSGKLGSFAVYNLSQQFAEWWPTGRLRRVRRRDHRELNAALPYAVALVRLCDPGALLPEGPLRLKRRGEEAAP